MVTRNEAFPSKYIGQDDVKERGGELVMTITGAEMTDVKNQRTGAMERKLVITFRNFDKPWIINQVNWDVVESLYGDNTDGWIGKQICLYVDENVYLGSEKVGGIRVKPPIRNVTPANRTISNGTAQLGQPSRTVSRQQPPPPDHYPDDDSEPVPF